MLKPKGSFKIILKKPELNNLTEPPNSPQVTYLRLPQLGKFKVNVKR